MTSENFIIKCFSLLNEVKQDDCPLGSSLYFQILLVYCVAMSLCGFLADVYNCEVEYKFSESAWLEELPLVERIKDSHVASLLPVISVLAAALSLPTTRD